MYDNFKSGLENLYSVSERRKRKHAKLTKHMARARTEYEYDREFYINIILFNFKKRTKEQPSIVS